MPDTPESLAADCRSDRLLELSAGRDARLAVQLKTPRAVLRAAPQTIERLKPHEEEILRLIEAGDPDVMRAIFSPAIDWRVAYMTPRVIDRTVSIHYEATLAGARLPPDGG